MDPVTGLLVAAGIGAVGSIGGTWVGNTTAPEGYTPGEQMAINRAQLYDNYEFSERAAQAANSRNIQNYQQFQSPLALRQQYEAAGLSPALMHGAGTGSSGQLAASSAATGQGVAAPNLAAMQMADQQTRMNSVQQALLTSQTIKNLVEAGMSIPQAQAVAKTAGASELMATTAQAQQKATQKVQEMTIKQIDQTIQESAEKINWLKSQQLTEIEKRNFTTSQTALNTQLHAFNQLMNEKQLKITDAQITKILTDTDEGKERIKQIKAATKGQLTENDILEITKIIAGETQQATIDEKTASAKIMNAMSNMKNFEDKLKGVHEAMKQIDWLKNILTGNISGLTGTAAKIL